MPPFPAHVSLLCHHEDDREGHTISGKIPRTGNSNGVVLGIAPKVWLLQCLALIVGSRDRKEVGYGNIGAGLPALHPAMIWRLLKHATGVGVGYSGRGSSASGELLGAQVGLLTAVGEASGL